MMWNDAPTSPFVLNEKGKEKQRVKREQAAVKIQKRWWMHMTKRLFKLLKHTIRAAEYCISYDILKRVSPLEAELLKEPTIQYKVRFRFAGCDFPPFIIFKIFCKSRTKNNQYISGKRVITSESKAAVDACKLMGYRMYYNQILQDELQNKRHGITDEIDIATIRDYMQYASHMDESPAYYGGRHNCWRKLTLENWPRAMMVYDIMDYAQSGNLSARLRAELPFLLLKPQNEETCRAQILAVCQIRSMSPGFITTSLSRQEQKAAQRMSQRRSYQARQKIAKMKKVYKAAKEEDLSSPLSDHSAGDPGPENQFSNEDWEQEAVMLYDWARSLQTEDIWED
ncbi:uncharacterized protein CXorf58 homolog isoform X2 [Ahaetulla prasina]|uniref:uncharacterized protein CXorf58 homolog isoform X2 n=1 Tax=Ahaetulla prasina TaxID=499056 RepID=UPI0026476A83|nr:uncharacterized protein CXorf58 homolog isoform X2 [Ahaetulla prasina]